MKFIKKKATNEPAKVIEKRNTPGSSFDDLPKSPLRKALIKEQGGICAYCMKRILDSSKTTKVEHFLPRTPQDEKNYMNLLAVCKGNEGNKGQEHCDTLKANQTIKISPLKSSCETLVLFDTGGKVYSLNENIDAELNAILGLNQQNLVDNRKLLLDNLKKEIESTAGTKKISKAKLNEFIKKWQLRDKNKVFQPFCRVAINYLEKRLARL